MLNPYSKFQSSFFPLSPDSGFSATAPHSEGVLRTLLTAWLLVILIFGVRCSVLGQSTGTVLIAPNEYANYEVGQEAGVDGAAGEKYIIIRSTDPNKSGLEYTRLGEFSPEVSTISRYMFDDDNEIEFSMTDDDGDTESFGAIVPLDPYGTGQPFQDEQSAYFLQSSHGGPPYSKIRLPGNTPAYDDFQYKLKNWSSGIVNGGEPTVDTVYVEETTYDTVYVENTITERIYTSATVYISETINITGEVDTVFINRTVTTRDTVYNVTQHTEYYTRIDSVYLLGGDYLDDLNRVTSIENELKVEKLSNPYPNPASEVVSIDYQTDVPTSNMFLGIYDSYGRRVEQFSVRSATSHTISFDVSDWSPGVYVYMIWSPVGVSTTKKLVVQ